MRRAKRLLFLAVSLVCFSCDVSWRKLKRWLVGTAPPGACVVLYYHEIGDREERFARQMARLSRWATLLPAGYDGPLEPGKHYAAVTFCDGFACFKEKALPVLTRRAIPAAVFVPSGLIGRRPDWPDDNDHPGLSLCELMDADALRSLPEALITVGSHGVRHTRLTCIDPAEAEEELRQSKRALEAILARSVDLFFFPYGECDGRTQDMAREAGYRRVFCNVPRLALRTPGEFLSGAIAADPGDWGLEFKLKALGAYRWRPWVSAAKRKIIVRRYRPSSFVSEG